MVRALLVACVVGGAASFAVPRGSLGPAWHSRLGVRVRGEEGAWSTSAGPSSTVIAGGGPSGLATSIMLARRGWKNIRVVDRLGEPYSPDDESLWSDAARFYLVGLGARGQKALGALGAWEAVEGYCAPVVGRKDWAPGAGADEGAERIFTDRPYTTQVIARDRLAGALYRHAKETYPEISFTWDCEISSAAFGDTSTRLHTSRGDTLETPFIVGADGTARTVAEAMADARVARGGVPVPSHLGRSRTESLGSLREPRTSDPPSTRDGRETARRGEMTSREAVSLKDDTRDPPPRESSSVGLPSEWRIQKAARHKDSRAPGPQADADPRGVRITRYDDDNERVFKTVPLAFPPGEDWRGDINYSARTKDGRVNFDALPAARSTSDLDRDSDAVDGARTYCAVLLLRASDELARADADPDALRQLLLDDLPQFEPFVDDATVRSVARKPTSRLPGFRFVGPKLHRDARAVLVGDAIHTVKPYFGLGANAAFEDVSALGRAFDEATDGARALEAFSAARGPDAKALVQISRGFDRPGLRGFLTFVLPIILDSLFHSIAPKLFGPNTIAALQQDGTFLQVRRRKRKDRLLQLATIASGLAAAAKAAKLLATRLLATPQSRRHAAGLAGLVAAAGLASKALPFFERGMAPADVLSKTKSNVSGSNESFLAK